MRDAATYEVEIPPKLVQVFDGPAFVRGAYGGRGSAKSRTFALMAAIRVLKWDLEGRSGIFLCARQFMNSLDDSSMDEIKGVIQSHDWLADHFDIGDRYIKTKSGRIRFAFAGLQININSIKGKSRLLCVWIDEAEPVTEEAFQKIIPTLREEDSELWLTWNPENARNAVNRRYRNSDDPRVKVVEINWRDNPWFPSILNEARKRDEIERPDEYGHIWEGEYRRAVQGSYFASLLADAEREGRISKVARDPLMSVRAYWDIGGTGARADATAIWLVQFVGKEVRWLGHYEAVGQPLEAHVAWLRSMPYQIQACVLPHDGATHDKVHKASYEGALKSAGFEVEVVPNQGAGAAKNRIEALRRILPQSWFNRDTTEVGREALAWYHEKIDPSRMFGLGPEHDWSSHSADAAGLVAISYQAQSNRSNWDRPIKRNLKVVV